MCVCGRERKRLLSFAFSDGHQFSIILWIRFLLSDNTVCSSVLQVRIILKKPKLNEICWYFLEPVHFTAALHTTHSGFYLLGFFSFCLFRGFLGGKGDFFIQLMANKVHFIEAAAIMCFNVDIICISVALKHVLHLWPEVQCSASLWCCMLLSHYRGLGRNGMY